MKYFIQKCNRLIVIMVSVSILTFLLVDRLPGDIAYEIAGQEASMEDIQAIRKELGLDRNIFVRYGIWLESVLRGNFGISFRTGEPVAEAILRRLPVTLELLIISQILAITLALPSGIISARKQESTLDKTVSGLGFAFMSIPNFVLALVLIYVFALKFKWFPATGYVPLSEGIVDNIRCFILPSLCIALVEWVPLMRVLRNDMIGVLREDYILMARSKGLPTGRILLKHALRPSSFTLVTLVGLHVGHLIGGALIVEMVFALPGIGCLLVGAIFGRDYQLVQACILLITMGYVTINFVVDMIYPILDPRLRTAGTY
jgi:peptide/nickel transport system permease protein